MRILHRLVLDGRMDSAIPVVGDVCKSLFGSSDINREILESKIFSLQKQIQERNPADRLHVLQDRFGLTDTETFLLSMGLFTELSGQAEALFSSFNLSDFGGLPSLQFALRLVDFQIGEDWPLSPAAPLVQLRLMDVFEKPPIGKIMDRFFRLNERVFRFLIDDNVPGEILRPYLRNWQMTPSWSESEVKKVADRVVERPVFVSADDREELRALPAQVAQSLQLRAMVLSAEEIEGVAKSADFIAEIFKEAVLSNSLIVLEFGREFEMTFAIQKIFSEAERYHWPLLGLVSKSQGIAIEKYPVVVLTGKNEKRRHSYNRQDLIFTPEQEKQFTALLNGIRKRDFVLNEWGFAQDFSTRKGVNILFFGASGTGKTLSAHIMANELQRSLHKIDLSSLVSKYIGETEKNIEKVFADLVGPSSVVFFDEAEALFATRSEQKTSNDRFSNLEINFLLQKMESHEGIVVLATNLEKNMDQAFFRRFDHALRFNLPDLNERRALWRSSFPPQAPLGNIDFELLAESMKISGASIRKIALNAALSMDSSDERIEMPQVFAAAEIEHRKLGLFFRNPLTEELR